MSMPVRPRHGPTAWFSGDGDARTATLDPARRGHRTLRPRSTPSGFDLFVDPPRRDRSGGAAVLARQRRDLDRAPTARVRLHRPEWQHVQAPLRCAQRPGRSCAGATARTRSTRAEASTLTPCASTGPADGSSTASAAATRRSSEPYGFDRVEGLGGRPGRVRCRDDARQPGTAVRLRSLMPSLPPAEQRVASGCSPTRPALPSSTISELAAPVRHLGDDGHPVLPRARAHRLPAAAARPGDRGRARRDQARRASVGSDIGPADDLSQVVEKIAFADARAVEETAEQLDLAVLERGRGGLVRRAADRRLRRRSQRLRRARPPAEAAPHRPGVLRLVRPARRAHQRRAAGPGRRRGRVLAHRGDDPDTIDALAEARRHGATTVAITNFSRSPITTVADHVLTTAARETTFRSGAMSSRIAQLTVVDCLFVGVAQRTYDETRGRSRPRHDAVSGRRVGAEGRRGDRHARGPSALRPRTQPALPPTSTCCPPSTCSG